MPDQTVVEASRNLMNADPILGSGIVLLMAVVAFLVFWIKGLLKEISEAKDDHLEDVKKYVADNATFRSVIEANTDQLRSNTETMKTMIEIIRDRERIRG